MSGVAWSEVFGEAMVEAARRDGKVCAVVAAMRRGTGLERFAKEFPDRFFDVGIREEMAVTFAAGLAKAGMRPVVAIYSTFLQRAIDQMQHDVCLQRLPVVFAVDRAGCVGEDGATHHGLYDIPLLRPLTGMRILAPCCADDLKEMLLGALAGDGPVAIRYPKGLSVAKAPVGGCGLSANAQPSIQVRLLAVGDQAAKAAEVAGEGWNCRRGRAGEGGEAGGCEVHGVGGRAGRACGVNRERRGGRRVRRERGGGHEVRLAGRRGGAWFGRGA